jgi:hypothetical protein
MLNSCAATDPFFRFSIDCTDKECICPKVKLLMALKCLSFGVSPSAFQDSFQVSYTLAQVFLRKFCEILSNDDGYKGVYHFQMYRVDARRLRLRGSG